MRSSLIVTGADLYYAPGDLWRVVPPKRATVIDPGPFRIVRQRQGAFYLVSWHRDDAGTAVLVDLDEGYQVRRCAVPRRELRGLWLETLAATGRTVAGVKAHGALLSAIADSGRDVTTGDLLRLAASDEGLPDGAFAVLAEVVDDER
jgi:hypothetical protein